MEPAYLSQSTGRDHGPYPAIARRGSIVSAAVAIFAGALLRLWMLHKFFEVSGDSRLYGGLAKNLLLHGRYAITDGSGVIHSTLIRLPGYPVFLAFCFRLFGIDRYAPACYVQIFLDLAACVLLALFVYRISSHCLRVASAQATLWLAALCPFTAVYAAEPLTESLTLFCIALALWSVARFQDRSAQSARPAWPAALSFTIAVTFAALLRPDGALVGVTLAPAILFALRGRPFTLATLKIPLVCLLLALAPFTLWTARNWTVFHVIQPLAPRYANDPGESTYPGWQRWVKTWALDFVSTYTIYWNVPDNSLDLKQLPDRAFDSEAQRAQTAALAADYEDNGEDLSPALDARFGQLADQRIATHPLRYYVLLPAGRVADMWLRPRVENLPIDLDWWVYHHHYSETRISWFYALLNAFYLVLGIAGLCLRPRLWPYMLAYMLLRSALLWTIEAPEARYTLECFPIVFALGGIAIGRAYRHLRTHPA